MEIGSCSRLLLLLRRRKRELHRRRHDDGYGGAVEERRRVLPLSDRVECRLVEERNRTEDAGVRDPSVGADHGFENDDSLNASGLGSGGIHRVHFVDLLRSLHAAADAHRSRRGSC